MRRVHYRLPITTPIAMGRVKLYGPLADLSGIDTTAPVTARELVQRQAEPGYGRQAYARGPWGANVKYAGYGRSGYGVQPWCKEVGAVRVPDRRSWEYGVLPVGVSIADRIGTESALLTASVLVNSSPATTAEAELSVAGGAIQMTITEWPNG